MQWVLNCKLVLKKLPDGQIELYFVHEQLVPFYENASRLATKAISTVLPKQYQVKDVPPKQGKDYNDLLCIKLNLAITKREKRTKKTMSGHEKYER